MNAVERALSLGTMVSEKGAKSAMVPDVWLGNHVLTVKGLVSKEASLKKTLNFLLECLMVRR